MRKFYKISYKQFKKDVCDDKELYNSIELPKRSTSKSAGYDIRSIEEYTLKPGESHAFKTGVKVEMNDDEVFFIFDRSSIGFKYDVCLSNSVGVIDADYENADNEGHIMICAKTDDRFDIKPNKAFCQGIFQKYYTIQNDNVSAVRTGGMGSTDKKNN